MLIKFRIFCNRLVKQSERTEQELETEFSRMNVYRYISVVEVLPKNFVQSIGQIGMTKNVESIQQDNHILPMPCQCSGSWRGAMLLSLSRDTEY